MMRKTITTHWDPADHLCTVEDMAAYLEEALRDGDVTVISTALSDIARAKGMSQIASGAGLRPDELEAALLPEGDPDLDTILKIIRALGLRLYVTPITA